MDTQPPETNSLKVDPLGGKKEPLNFNILGPIILIVLIIGIIWILPHFKESTNVTEETQNNRTGIQIDLNNPFVLKRSDITIIPQRFNPISNSWFWFTQLSPIFSEQTVILRSDMGILEFDPFNKLGWYYPRWDIPLNISLTGDNSLAFIQSDEPFNDPHFGADDISNLWEFNTNTGFNGRPIPFGRDSRSSVTSPMKLYYDRYSSTFWFTQSRDLFSFKRSGELKNWREILETQFNFKDSPNILFLFGNKDYIYVGLGWGIQQAEGAKIAVYEKGIANWKLLDDELETVICGLSEECHFKLPVSDGRDRFVAATEDFVWLPVTIMKSETSSAEKEKFIIRLNVKTGVWEKIFLPEELQPAPTPHFMGPALSLIDVHIPLFYITENGKQIVYQIEDKEVKKVFSLPEDSRLLGFRDGYIYSANFTDENSVSVYDLSSGEIKANSQFVQPFFSGSVQQLASSKEDVLLFSRKGFGEKAESGFMLFNPQTLTTRKITPYPDPDISKNYNSSSLDATFFDDSFFIVNVDQGGLDLDPFILSLYRYDFYTERFIDVLPASELNGNYWLLNSGDNLYLTNIEPNISIANPKWFIWDTNTKSFRLANDLNTEEIFRDFQQKESNHISSKEVIDNLFKELYQSGLSEESILRLKEELLKYKSFSWNGGFSRDRHGYLYRSLLPLSITFTEKNAVIDHESSLIIFNIE